MKLQAERGLAIKPENNRTADNSGDYQAEKAGFSF